MLYLAVIAILIGLAFFEEWLLYTYVPRLIARAKSGKWEPDLYVGGKEDPYMIRRFLLPRNKFFNIYLHEFRRSDEDAALHDHPAANLSWLVRGYYDEETIAAGGVHYIKRYHAPALRFRFASTAHRLIIDPRVDTWSIWISGPKWRHWGFHCPRGWIPWEKFIEGGNYGNRQSKTGEGCGEFE